MTVLPENTPASAWADARISDLRDLGARALECWLGGDAEGARDAAREAGAVAVAAAAAVEGLLELARRAADEQQRKQDDVGDASHWLG